MRPVDSLVPKVLEFALKSDIIAMPGALTPSEVIAAWQSEADFVKILSGSMMGGDQYIRALKIPLPQIRLIASGGVNQLTATNFIYERARRFLSAVQNARVNMASMDTD
jgi:2-keto-3-deoxy-6-phosphogluconate aldolase